MSDQQWQQPEVPAEQTAFDPFTGAPLAQPQPGSGQPAYGQAAPGQPVYNQAQAPSWQQPVPGQQAPAAQPFPAYAPYPDPSTIAAQSYPGAVFATAPTGPVRKTWDLVLTIVLLVIGFFGAFFGVISGAGFEEGFLNGLQLQGYSVDQTPEGVGSYGLAIALSHVLLYLVAVGISIPLLVKKKMAFYVPLGAGVLAAVIYWGLAIVAGIVFTSALSY